MREEFDKNLDKFEVYTSRNVFLPTLKPIPVSNSTAVASSGASGSRPHAAELEVLTAEIDGLKARYLDLRAAHSRLSNECRDADLLLKDMRNAMFHLRVGSQVLDENNIQSLEDSVASLTQYRLALTKLTKTAEGESIFVIITSIYIRINVIY